MAAVAIILSSIAIVTSLITFNKLNEFEKDQAMINKNVVENITLADCYEVKIDPVELAKKLDKLKEIEE